MMEFKRRHNKGSNNLYLLHRRSLLGGFDVVKLEKYIHFCPKAEAGMVAWGP